MAVYKVERLEFADFCEFIDKMLKERCQYVLVTCPDLDVRKCREYIYDIKKRKEAMKIYKHFYDYYDGGLITAIADDKAELTAIKVF